MTNGNENILVRCECGELGITHHAWYHQHLTEQFRLICKDCKKTARVVK